MYPTSARRNLTLLGTVLLVSAAAACQSADKPTAVADDVWAVVDGREIRRAEVETAYRGVVQPTANTPSADEALTAKLGIIEELINTEIMLEKARVLNLAVTDAEVDTAFAERKRNMTDDAFQQQLNKRGLTIDDMKRGVRRELTVQKLIERDVVSKIAITDQDISDFYAANRAQFNVAETQYRIAQIVVTPRKEPELRNRLNDDAGTPEEADRKAKMLAERLRTGTDFATLAMDYSEDPQSAVNGGDLGFIPASSLKQVTPQLRDAVLRSSPGTVNTVSVGGSHTLVMLVSREEAGQRELSAPDVREGIRDALRQHKEQLLRTAYLAAARNDAKVVNHLARRVVSAQGKLPTLAPTAPGKQ